MSAQEFRDTSAAQPGGLIAHDASESNPPPGRTAIVFVKSSVVRLFSPHPSRPLGEYLFTVAVLVFHLCRKLCRKLCRRSPGRQSFRQRFRQRRFVEETLNGHLGERVPEGRAFAWLRPRGRVRGSLIHVRYAVFHAAVAAAVLLGGPDAMAALETPAQQQQETRTLVLFSAPRLAYGLGDELEFLQLQLRSVATRVEAIPLSTATNGQMEQADHLIVFCPDPAPFIPPAALSDLLSGARPVLWVGHIAESLRGRPPFSGAFAQSPNVDTRVGRVVYRGRDWELGDAHWLPVQLTPEAAAAATTSILMSLAGEPSPPRAPQGAPGRLPLCWRQGGITFFSAVPTPGLLGFLFADSLLDFYGAAGSSPASSRLLLRIDDYQAGSDHQEFQRKVDFLGSRGRPFAVSVTPSWRDSPTGPALNLDAAPEFVSGLRYAQLRGGRLLVRGCARELTDRPEFWDADLDRPLTNAPAEVERKLQEAAGLMLKHDLLPLGWVTPQNAASQAVYREVARVFSTSIERPQLSDLTHRETALLSVPTRDRAGRRVIPENLGFVPAAGTNEFGPIRDRAEWLMRLRGTVACAYFHAYVPQEKLSGLMGVLEELKNPFLDLSELNNWVHIPGSVLLTGGAEQTVRLAGGVLTWKAFDRSGRLAFIEQEFALPGQRNLRRKGKGTYELYQFAEMKP